MPKTARPVTIYGLLDPSTAELRYIGKTIEPLARRLIGHRHAARKLRPQHVGWWIRSLWERDLQPEIFEVEALAAGDDWIEAERFWIAYFRSIGAKLTNVTDGGEGTNGWVQSPETVAKRVAHLIGRKLSPAHREKIRASRTGRKMPPGFGLRIGAMIKGQKRTAEQRAKMSAAQKARCHRHSPEAKQKIGEAYRRRWAALSDLERATTMARLRAAALRQADAHAQPDLFAAGDD